jgi:hypothetical protein
MKGEESPVLSGDQARMILAYVIVIQKSAQERREIYIDELGSPEGAEYSRKKIVEDIARHSHRKMVSLQELSTNPRLL